MRSNQVVRSRGRRNFIGVSGSATKFGVRFKGSAGIKTRSRAPQPDSANVVSTQFDQKQLFRRRPLTRGRKLRFKRSRRFAKKVTKVAEEMFGIQRNILTDFTNTSSGPGAQGFLTDFNLLFCDGLAGDRDMRQIASTYLQDTSTTANQNHVFYRTAILDWTISNDATTASDTAPVFIDLYEFVCKKDVPASTYSTLNAVFSVINPPTAGGSALTTLTYGYDPFTSNAFTEYFSITKVTETQVPSGGTIRGRITKTLNRKIVPQDFRGYLAKKGISCGMMAIFYGSPSSTGEPVASSLNLNYVKQINVQINEIIDAGSAQVPP